VPGDGTSARGELPQLPGRDVVVAICLIAERRHRRQRHR